MAAAFGAGSLPFSHTAAWWLTGVDLRSTGTGTVSGTGLYEVAGFLPLAAAGSLEVAKGALGPLLAGPARPYLAAAAAGAAVAGHNWSPWLRGAGGRGLSPAIGAMTAQAPEGAALLLSALAFGRVARQTGLVTGLAVAALPLVLTITRGRRGLTTGLAVAVPMLAKRLAGNGPSTSKGAGWQRLLFDREPGSTTRLHANRPPTTR